MGCAFMFSIGDCGCGGGCDQPFHVNGCDGSALSGATVDVQSPPGTSIVTGTTDASGDVTSAIPATGDYTVVVSKPGTGYETKTQTLSLDCSTTQTIALAIDGTVLTTLDLHSNGTCNSELYPDDTLSWGSLPHPVAGQTEGWVGSTQFNLGGALGFSDYIYMFAYVGGNKFDLYAYTASGGFVLGLALANYASCSPFLWATPCGSNSATQPSFGGSITEP